MLIENYVIFTVDINRPSESTINQIVERLQQTGSVKDKRVEKCNRSVRTWFVKKLLKTLKYPLLDVYNKLDLVKSQHGLIYERA